MTPDQRDYLVGKLILINLNMAVHIGDANRRLASESETILQIPTNLLPLRYQESFEDLREVIKKTLNKRTSPWAPYKLDGIRNYTAVKYIKLLWEIQDVLQGELTQVAGNNHEIL